MAALSDLSDVVRRATGGAGAFENWGFFKDNRVAAAAAAATIAGRWTSLWEYNGHPAGGSAPGAVAAPTRATTGALMQANPGASRQKWITGLAATASQQGTLVLYDRLLHISGFDGTSTSAQTVGGAITRYTAAASVGNQIWVEIYTQIGAAGTTITSSYTDQDGNASTTVAATIGGTGFREAQRLLMLPLAAGDTGVRGVTSVTLAGSTGTAGNFGVTIARPLLSVSFDAEGVGGIRDCITAIPGPQEILTDACLAWAWIANGTTAPMIFGTLHSVEA